MFHRQCIHPAEFEVPIFQCVLKLYGFEDDTIGDLLRIGSAGYFGFESPRISPRSSVAEESQRIIFQAVTHAKRVNIVTSG
jgi:hypothetical protein